MNFDIETIKRKMLVKYPFFGSIVANAEYKENNTIETAGTDGDVIYYNSNYLNSKSVDEQIFIFSHEVCHIAFNHILRSEGKDPYLWNIATDAVINAFLKKDGLKLSKGVVDMDVAINYDSEELYEKLLKEKQRENQNDQNSSGENSQSSDSKGDSQITQSQDSQKQSQNSNSKSEQEDASEDKDSSQVENQDVGHDTHSMWKDAVKKYKNDNLDNNLYKNNCNKKEEQNEIKKKQEAAEELGEKESFKKNKEEKRKQLEKLKETLSQEVMKQGDTTNGDIRNINDIGRAKAIIDWRYVLKEAINYDVDWSYKNATIEDGVVVANLERQQVPETEILLDTSGSVNDDLLKNFLRECMNILSHSKLKVGCFDDEFYGFNEIRTEEDIENMKFQGRGGTDFDVAVNAFSRKVENKIIFTDGEAMMPKIPMDAIWLVYGNNKIEPKGGIVIQIDDKRLNRLKLHHYETESESKGRNR